MTKFNPKNKDVNYLTYSDTLGPAMEITDEEDATNYLKEYVWFLHEHSPKKEIDELLQIARKNLGYFAGYYDTETRLRVERLFNCQHPIFGKASEGVPSPKEAFEAGFKMGKK